MAPWLALFSVTIWPASANAAPMLNVTFTSPATVANCNLTPGSGDETETGTAPMCTSTAYFPVLANINSTFITGNFDITPPTNQTFGSTFTNWNVSQGANFGGMWAIINGGALDVTFNVTDIAGAHINNGGIDNFTVNITMNPGYAGPPINQLVWTQAVYASFDPMGGTDLKPAANTLDTWTATHGTPAGCTAIPGQTPGPNNNTPAVIGASPPFPAGYCDPLYPFQFADKHFADAPMGPWPDESFRAIALLSTVTFKTDATGAITERDLTVYNGVSWGFDLAVPEPGPSLLIISGLALGALLRRRVV
jgi:hypothetical protein